jgi:hypothetical protein
MYPAAAAGNGFANAVTYSACEPPHPLVNTREARTRSGKRSGKWVQNTAPRPQRKKHRWWETEAKNINQV